MNCAKCGAELHEDQKVCIKCGTRTIAGGGFQVEETTPWKPSRAMIAYASALIAIIIIILIARSFVSQPPDKIANDWFNAISQRKMGDARQYQSPEFEQSLSERQMDMFALADSCFAATSQDGGKPTIQVDQIDQNTATATIDITLPEGGTNKQIVIRLAKSGRTWLVTELVSSTV